jgi:hypothetical protein
VGDLNPGQNQKSILVGDHVEIFLPGRYIPSDKSVPDSNVPGSGRPDQTGNWPVMEKGHILEMFSNRLGIVQIMILADEAVTKLLLRGPADLLQMYREKVADGATDWRLINLDGDRQLPIGQGIRGAAFGRRQLYPSLGLQKQQQASTHHVLESAIGLPPIPCPANLLGNETPAALGMGRYDFLDNRNI